MNILSYIYIILLFLNIVILFTYSLNHLLLTILALKNRKKSLLVKKKLSQYPFVTIQLPLFNEKYVVKRVIENAVKIDYPKNRFEVQILDDSTDNTLEMSKKIVEKYKKEGYNIELLHRKERTDHKAGALREGLVKAKGEFLAIFDADFIPAKDILKSVIPYFLEDKRVGMVQTRWGHINSNYSIFTQAQALCLDTHFSIEQVARNASNFFMNFTGTAGIWRKQCILDAGNWQQDTLTEDLDISYRAELKEWKLRYIHDVVNDAELPVQLSAFKIQQFRWAKGSIQNTIKHIKEVFNSTKPLSTKLQAFFHLSRPCVHPLLLLNILLTIPLIKFPTLYELSASIFGSLASIFSIGIVITLLSFVYSQINSHMDWKRRLKWIPISIMIQTGIAVNNSFAVLEALIGLKSEFIRTPKLGVIDKKEKWRKRFYTTKVARPFIPLIELFFGCASLFGVISAIQNQIYFILPFYIIYTIAFFYIFIVDILQNRFLVLN